MDKKKFTSWGVSFASLALVAGMMSYLESTNKDTTSKTSAVAQSQVTTQNSTQDSQNGNNQNSSPIIEIPNQTGNSGSQQSMNQSFSRQHGNFDTTTGGS